MRPRRRGRWLLLGLALLAAFVAADYYLYPLLPDRGVSHNRGENGLWLRYWWYTGERSEADIRQLAADLPRHQVAYAWFHVRSALAHRRPGRPLARLRPPPD